MRVYLGDMHLLDTQWARLSETCFFASRVGYSDYSPQSSSGEDSRKGCIVASSLRLVRQFCGVMDGLLSRHCSEKCAYSCNVIFGNGGSIPVGTFGNSSTTQLLYSCSQIGIEGIGSEFLAKRFQFAIHLHTIFDHQIHDEVDILRRPDDPVVVNRVPADHDARNALRASDASPHHEQGQ